MIYISEAINILNNGEPHDIEFVSKTKGNVTQLNQAIVLSSNYKRRKFNMKSTISKQIRWVYYVLIISIDKEEVYL